MTTHFTSRMGWQYNGRKGPICKRVANDTHSVGYSSYSGELVPEKRDLVWEKIRALYEKHFSGRLLVGQESETLGKDAADVFAENLS